jgi:hypothetical protein
MILLTLRVTHNGDTNEYPVGPKVQVAFEREWKMGMPGAFTDNQKMEHLYWLAWKAQQTSGAVVKPFDGWLEGVESVEIVEVDRPL